MAYFNFETNPKLSETFEESISPDYHIIVAGSLLGVAVNMEEFMLAMEENALVEQIKKCFASDTPMPSALHTAAMQLYRQYLVVGGMPECVMQFVQTRDYILVRHTQDTILVSYLNDMSKYNNLNEIKKPDLLMITSQFSFQRKILVFSTN